MAIFRADVRSKVLEMDTQLVVIHPYDRLKLSARGTCKILYLLHGLAGNASSWARKTAIEQYAIDKEIVVVMPEVQRSFYFDMDMGLDYFRYITSELPTMCKSFFNFSARREDTFIAGLSMGGYGALKCGFSRPELYAGCASFSGILDIGYITEVEDMNERYFRQCKAVLGNDLVIKPKDDLGYLSTQLMQLPPNQRPSVFITCGQQDFLYNVNQKMTSHFEDIGLDFVYKQWPGEHTWDFWDTSVSMALDFFIP